MRAVFLILLIALTSCAMPQVKTRSIVADPVKNFALLDHQGLLHELYYYSDKAAIVLIAQGNGCPILRQEIVYLEKLRNTFAPQGVEFFMINANPQDDTGAIVTEAKEYGISMPILLDKAQYISKALKINRIAQAVVIDPKTWRVVYNGAVNDQYGYESQRKKISRHYLKEALEAVLAKRPVPVDQAATQGCLINFTADEKDAAPDYATQVAPILINRCISCHTPGGIAPWAMDKAQTLKGWSAMIKEVVLNKRMPPWGADEKHRALLSGTYMTPEQERTLLDWIDAGAPVKGTQDPLLTAAPREDQWPLGPPDMILTLDHEQDIPANGIVEYRDAAAQETILQDQWVRAIYWKPTNRKVMHHAILYALNEGKLDHPQWFYRSGYMESEKGRSIRIQNDMVHLMDTYVPGQQPFVAPQDSGLYLPKGTHFAFQLHYTTIGKPQKDNLQVGLYFYKQRPPKVLTLRFSYNHQVLIPPLVKDFVLRSSYTFKKATTLYAIRPHMHTRGRRVEYVLMTPDGKKETILAVAHYRFLWQFRYIFKDPLYIPAGARIDVIGHYDNSAQNPDNPNPNQWITYGMQTDNEMLGSMFYTADDE